jgi:hypothetical protein
VILEGIVTSLNEDGSVNISPMGPIVDGTMSYLVLRPYQTSTTYRNLKRSPEGVFHVTDDVELLARAAVGPVDPLPRLTAAHRVRGRVLADACRWYEFRVSHLDDRTERTEIRCDVVHEGRIRDFFGFNRAKHAVVEASILATRIGLVPGDEILAEYQRLSKLVQKTAGPQERRAFEFLCQYVQTAISSERSPMD